MSRNRGFALQRALAAYLRYWWPCAESNPNGRPGSDVLGTPGVVWECKTPRRFDPYAWTMQAHGHAARGELPVVVYWPDGIGDRRPELALMIVPLREGIELLRKAGY